MNNYKLAFWTCLALLMGVSMFSGYSIIDQGVSSTYQSEGYADTENDLDQLIEIINQTDLSKSQIQQILRNHEDYDMMDFNTDSVALDRVLLIFDKGKLKKVEKQW